ncbi:MAG: hypothetical protein KAU48_10860 [Candidatus Thorarchaeota archaeon]|nr:hypothetical protein [Candidatus Thorarchaeota archaeon]
MRACNEKLDCAFAVDPYQLLLTYLYATFLINPSENHSFYETKDESSSSLNNFDAKIPFKRRETVRILVLWIDGVVQMATLSWLVFNITSTSAHTASLFVGS